MMISSLTPSFSFLPPSAPSPFAAFWLFCFYWTNETYAAKIVRPPAILPHLLCFARPLSHTLTQSVSRPYLLCSLLTCFASPGVAYQVPGSGSPVLEGGHEGRKARVLAGEDGLGQERRRGGVLSEKKRMEASGGRLYMYGEDDGGTMRWRFELLMMDRHCDRLSLHHLT